MTSKNGFKPVRKIGVTTRSVSGIVPEIGRYESSLERDFMEICRFDDSVLKVIPQPVVIPYLTRSDQIRSYTPDGLLYFKEELIMNPILFEIKYQDDFKENRRLLLPKFRAAKDYANNLGWDFHVITENYIRTTYLENIKFLWPFKNRKPPDSYVERVLGTMFDLIESDPDMLIHILCKDKTNRAQMIPVIWYMVSNSLIGCDLDQPLTMNSVLWYRGGYEDD